MQVLSRTHAYPILGAAEVRHLEVELQNLRPTAWRARSWPWLLRRMLGKSGLPLVLETMVATVWKQPYTCTNGAKR